MHVLMPEEELKLVGSGCVLQVLLGYLHLSFSSLCGPHPQAKTDLLLHFFCVFRHNMADQPHRRSDRMVDEESAGVEETATVRAKLFDLLIRHRVAGDDQDCIAKLQGNVGEAVDVDHLDRPTFHSR